MRLKTKLVLAITGMVFALVLSLSAMFLAELLWQRVEQTYSNNDVIAHQVLYATRNAIESGLREHPVNVADATALHSAVASSLLGDRALQSLLNSIIRYAPTVLDISVADSSNIGLISTDPSLQEHLLPRRLDYASVKNGGAIHQLSVVFGPPANYDITLPIERNGLPFATVHVGIRTTFLRTVYEPWLNAELTLIGLAIGGSLLFAAFLSHTALRPLEEINARLDQFVQAEQAEPELEIGDRDEVTRVSNKIERFGRRMRNVEEVFSALRENVNQILGNLQDGMMLFTRDARAILVSDSAHRFLNLERQDLLGAELHDIFDRNTVLGLTVRQAFDARMSLLQQEILTETGRRIEVSLDFIHDDRSDGRAGSLGALLTLHDSETMRQIESELELSRRLAAIGRLTSGVGHEVKNPINAIVVHLELLRNKLGDNEPRALRHLDIIQSEIQRLDRVVQTLVDFSRPVELDPQDQDLRGVLSAVLMLASAELETRAVQIESTQPAYPVMAKVDADLLRQALLNVVLNGAQAMPVGGLLQVSLSEDSRYAIIGIRDHGAGIPEDIRDKIFNLYFTTKKEGSGIGLAMTYRIMQLHNGSIEVESQIDQGTAVILRLPLSHVPDLKLRSNLDPVRSFVSLPARLESPRP